MHLFHCFSKWKFGICVLCLVGWCFYCLCSFAPHYFHFTFDFPMNAFRKQSHTHTHADDMIRSANDGFSSGTFMPATCAQNINAIKKQMRKTHLWLGTNKTQRKRPGQYTNYTTIKRAHNDQCNVDSAIICAHSYRWLSIEPNPRRSARCDAVARPRAQNKFSSSSAFNLCASV